MRQASVAQTPDYHIDKQHPRASLQQLVFNGHIMKESITILIHGTFGQSGQWHRPGSRFHRYIKREVFDDVYSGDDFFSWSGESNNDPNAPNDPREKAAKRLVEWCKDHPAKSYNLISHSHGTNVANIATHIGLDNVNKLIHLSPPVWSSNPLYLPKMSSVSQKVIYNFHPRFDFIVNVLARASQNYDGTRVDRYETEFVLRGGDHWAPTYPSVWRRNNIGDIVSNDELVNTSITQDPKDKKKRKRKSKKKNKK